jgi:hypothetical protein
MEDKEIVYDKEFIWTKHLATTTTQTSFAINLTGHFSA